MPIWNREAEQALNRLFGELDPRWLIYIIASFAIVATGFFTLPSVYNGYVRGEIPEVRGYSGRSQIKQVVRQPRLVGRDATRHATQNLFWFFAGLASTGLIGYFVLRASDRDLYGDFDDVPEMNIPGTPHDYNRDTGPYKRPGRSTRKP